MSRFLIIFAFAFLAVEAVQAETMTFSCTTTSRFQIDNEIQKVTFGLEVDNKLNPTQAEIPYDTDFISSVSPEEASYFYGLGENGGATFKKMNGKDVLVVDGDSDGFYLIDLVLYKNSGYSRGYVRVSHNQSGPDEYSTIVCDVK